MKLKYKVGAEPKNNTAELLYIFDVEGDLIDAQLKQYSETNSKRSFRANYIAITFYIFKKFFYVYKHKYH